MNLTDLPALFHEVAIVLFVAAIMGFLGLMLKQPLIVSFIAAGLLIGPSVLDLTEPSPYMELLAELGISVLLFIVGLKLDLALIRTTGKVALMTGLGQVLFTSVIGYLICRLMGLDATSSLYVAIALTFSSTIIIVKLLSDKGEIESLHGRVAMGFLIVQDLVVVLMMIVMSAFGLVGQEADLGSTLLGVLLKGMILLGFLAIFIRYLAEPVLKKLSTSYELMLISAIAWAALLAAITDQLGFSKELGALLAGVSLASTSYRDLLGGRLTGLRDFLLLFFFINLGTHIDLRIIDVSWTLAIALSLFVLIGNPMIVMVIMGLMGYRSRTSFLAGLTVAQISEFSLIFVALGNQLGHVGLNTVGLVTVVGLITIALSTYMILASHGLYTRLHTWLGIFERKTPHREVTGQDSKKRTPIDIIVVGLGRYGGYLLEELKRQEIPSMGIDFNPEVVRQFRKKGMQVHYGDATDPELLERSPICEAKAVIVAIPPVRHHLAEYDLHMAFHQNLKAQQFKGITAFMAQTISDVERLSKADVALVLEPYRYAAWQTVEILRKKLGPVHDLRD